NPEKLSAQARLICEDGSNTLFLSLASIWEISIKVSIKKIDLRLPLESIVKQQYENGVQLLPIKVDHLYRAASLPHYHRDPFDRLIIAQAQIEDLTLISVDSLIKKYAVRWID
ncbi:MAG: type II toxin-antitoxin system VapC family toxin, partial [Planctomycetota bacterium]